MQVSVLGKERRRRWTLEQKIEIVTSVGVNGASLTDVAQRYDVTRQQIYYWRHILKKTGVLADAARTTFAPVETTSSHPDLSMLQGGVDDRTSTVELTVHGGRRLSFDSSIDGSTLTRIIRSVEAA